MLNISEYENLIYTIKEKSTFIESSNLTLQRRGKFYCWNIGSINFQQNVRLEISEVLDFAKESFIRKYSYSVYQNNQKLYWYDSQGHPGDPNLLLTHPHHKHIPPDIKHNRIPAPNLSFKEQNLIFLIREIEQQFF